MYRGCHYGRGMQETPNSSFLANDIVLHDGEFGYGCSFDFNVALATNVFHVHFIARINVVSCKEAPTFVGPRERVAGAWLLRPELARIVQCEGVQGENAYGCFYI